MVFVVAAVAKRLIDHFIKLHFNCDHECDKLNGTIHRQDKNVELLSAKNCALKYDDLMFGLKKNKVKVTLVLLHICDMIHAFLNIRGS